MSKMNRYFLGTALQIQNIACFSPFHDIRAFTISDFNYMIFSKRIPNNDINVISVENFK